MAKGTYTATAADSVIVAASEANHDVEILYYSGDAGYLGFGEAGVVGQGIKIDSAAPYYKIPSGDPRLLLDVHMICDTGLTQTGGYQTI
jgi:hypothetical protein